MFIKELVTQMNVLKYSCISKLQNPSLNPSKACFSTVNEIWKPWTTVPSYLSQICVSSILYTWFVYVFGFWCFFFLFLNSCGSETRNKKQLHWSCPLQKITQQEANQTHENNIHKWDTSTAVFVDFTPQQLLQNTISTCKLNASKKC